MEQAISSKYVGRKKRSTLLRYARDPTSFISPNTTLSEDEKKIDRKIAKVFCLSFSTCSIIAIFVVLVLLFFFNFPYRPLPKLTEETPNQTLRCRESFDNYTFPRNLTLECPPAYIYSQKDHMCVYPCGWFHACGPSCILAERVIFTIMSILSIFLSFVNIISWPFVGSLKSFTHIGIFFVICITTVMVFLLAIIDIPGIDYFFCNNEKIGVKEVNALFLIRINIFGSIYDFVNILTLIWLFFSIFNIFLTVVFQNRFTNNRKLKQRIVILEIFLSILPITVFVVPLSKGFSYHYVDTNRITKLHSDEFLYFLQFLPCIIVIGAIYTLSVILMTYLHMIKISLTKFRSMHKPTSLEKRFIILSILTVFYLVYIFCNSIWLSFVNEAIETRLTNHLLCVTMLSKPNLNGTSTNSTFGEVLMNHEFDRQFCEESSFANDDLYPGFLNIINNILTRSLWLPTFLLTLPDGLLDLISEYFKRCFKVKRKNSTFQSHLQGNVVISNSDTSIETKL